MHPVSFIFLSFSLSLSLFTNELEKQTNKKHPKKRLRLHNLYKTNTLA